MCALNLYELFNYICSYKKIGNSLNFEENNHYSNPTSM